MFFGSRPENSFAKIDPSHLMPKPPQPFYIPLERRRFLKIRVLAGEKLKIKYSAERAFGLVIMAGP